MPRTPNRKKRARRSSTVGVAKSRPRRRNALVSVPRNKIGFPQMMRTKLRYSTRVEFTPSGTDVQQFQLRATGLFDPQVNLGGHQPRGFDEFMKTYETYTVHGSRCSGSFMCEGYLGPTRVTTTGNLIQSIGDGSPADQITPALTLWPSAYTRELRRPGHFDSYTQYTTARATRPRARARATPLPRGPIIERATEFLLR